MSTSTRRHLAFALGLSAVVAMSGFLLNAAPPQAVGTWEVLGTTDPSSARSGAATATLEDDTTLIAGGRMLDGTVTDSVLVYDPTTNASTVVGHLASPRVNAAAARLDDGRVLIVGGEIADLLSADAEIFDPFTGTSDVVANMAVPRTRHAATRLADGKVLIVGGVTLENVTLATAEVFDPETGSILEVGSMGTPRAGASATLLIDNRVLVAGGNDGTQDLASAELFYPATQEFFPVDTPLSQARAGHTAVLLPHNGAVLIAGGTADNAPVTTTDLFLPTMFPDPYTWSMGTFGPAEHLTHARNQAVSGPMGDDGYAFVAGGGMPEGEAYAFVTLKTDRDDYAPGEPALITGSGWQVGEEVELVFQEDPAVHPDYVLTLTADGDGKISHHEWAPEAHDANVRFYLMATGRNSHRRAQMTFTDSVTSVTITSPTGGSPVTVAPAGTFTVSFGYVTSASGATNATARFCQAMNCNGGNTIASASKSVTPGTASDSIVLTVPSGTAAGSNYTVEVEVTNFTSGGSNSKLDKQNNSLIVTGAKTPTSTIVTCPASVTYTGIALTPCTVSVTGAGGLNLAPAAAYLDNINVGSATASYSYPGDATYAPSSDSKTFTINQAPSTTLLTCPASVTYTGSALAPCSANVTGAGGLNQALTVNYTNNTNAGTATGSASFGGDANHTGSSDSEDFTIGKAASVTTVTIVGGPFTYTGSPLTPATVTVTGAGLNLTPTADYANNTDAGTATASYSFGGDANHTGSSDSEDFTIGKAASVTTVTIVGGPFTYTGSPLTPATVTVTGAGLNLTPTADYANNTDAGTATASYSFGGDANHTGSTDSEDFTIGKAASVTTVTIVGGPFTYTGSPLTPATVTVTGAGLNLTPTADYANNTDAGTATASYSFGGDANHTGSSDSEDFTIGKAASVTTVTIVGGPFTYTGSPLTPATVTVTGAGLNLTPTADYANNTDAGTATASYSFGGDANHTGSSDSEDFTIGKAASVTTVTIVGGPFTYTGSPLTPATVTVTGAGLNLTPTADYANNTDAGTATASYSFGGDANHTGSSDSEDFTIGKAASVTTVTIVGGPFTYTGSPLTPATVTVTGAGLNLTPTADYANNTDAGTATASYSFGGDANHTGSTDSENFTIGKAASVTTVTIVGGPFTYTGSPLTPATVTVTGAGLNLTPTADYANNTDAGTATASYSFGGDANHTGSTDSENFTIGKAASVTTVTIVGGPFTYTGSPLTPATVTVTGAGLNLTPTADYANNTDAGTATASYSFGGDANHTGSSDSEDFTIGKAASVTTVTIVGGPFTYTGSPLTPATVTVTGAGLNLTPTADYANNTDAGTATASYSFGGDANHTGSSDSEDFTIGKAASVTTVTIVGGPFTYTGSPLTPATVTVTGAGLNLTPTADYANNTDAGTATASYSFGGDANHTGSSDSENFTIGKAASVTTVTIVGGPFVYYGAAHTPATVTVTGPGALTLMPTAVYVNNVNAGTATASYSFGGDANHTGSTDSENFTISPKPATWTTSSASKTLGALDPVPLTTGFGGGFLAVDGVAATYSRTLGETLAGNPYHITSTLGATTGLLTNYAITNVGASFTIGYATTGMCLGSPGHQVLQPLNIDGTSVVKKGSTVPVKFRVCDANGNSIGTAGVVTNFQLVQTIDALATSTVNEEPLSTTPDAAFRWSPSDQQWIFNLSTKNLGNGKTYVYRITLNDGSTINFQFGTKQ